MYVEMFKGDVEIYRHVRVVFTGREGAGKTTACQRLQKKEVDLNIRKPTVGAVLHPNWFSVDKKSKEWIQNDDKSASEILEIRLGITMKKAQTNKKAGLQTGFRESATDLSMTSSQTYDLYEKHFEECNAVQEASQHANMDGVLLSLWDMGGHSSFQASHNVFISSHGVYLLVFRLTDFLKDKLETDRLKKWIRMIGTFSSVELNAPKLKEHEPPLIFVGTFLDELRRISTDYEGQVQAIQSSISKFPELSSHKFVRFCTLDNSQGTEPAQLSSLHVPRTEVQNPRLPSTSRNDDANLKQLRGTIIELAEHQDQWGRKLPTRWLKLEMDLLKARERGTKILTLAKVIEMNETSIAPLADVAEIVLALEYLHCTRSVIYFREFDHVINDPQWLADCFSLLITDDMFLPKDNIVLSRDLELYKTKGELTLKLIDALLSIEKNKEFLPHKPILLALMEKFGLMVRILISESSTGNARFSETYSIPSKLMELQNTDGMITGVNNLELNNLAVSKTLCLIFRDVFVPEELFHRVFATIMKTYRSASLSATHIEDDLRRNLLTTEDTTCLYRGFGCFEVNDLCRMILSMHWERSTIAVTLFSPSESKLPPNSGQLVRTTLERILKDTLQMSSQQHFQFTHKLHCNFHLSPYDTPVELYSVIHAEGGMSCKGGGCRGKHRLKKSDLLFWGITKFTVHLHGLGSSDEATCLDRRPTPQELGRLSYIIKASECEQLFIALGLSLPEISNIEHQTRSLVVVTQITRMFLKWTYAYPNQTFRNIAMAMSKVDIATDSLGESVETGLECVILDDMESNEDRLKRPLLVSEIGSIVDNIDKDYFNLFLELGLSVHDIEKCEVDQPSVKRRVETLIKLWINTSRDQATVIRIVKAMKLCKMDWYSTAMAYCVGDEEETGEWPWWSWWRCAIL
ncbi:serine/threonine-protein kinase roco5 [Mizuhopecten yessoensis]|uniref:Serine/threonine-protein kinase roco5 n=1 Tax=Mizuhopecten yessoensis TaxID=6573 RepID=A0A210Q740_MIZYE|nr:serine/threonine-protein kinase roco5 [Mizuhopecten yessoensis]